MFKLTFIYEILKLSIMFNEKMSLNSFSGILSYTPQFYT